MPKQIFCSYNGWAQAPQMKKHIHPFFLVPADMWSSADDYTTFFYTIFIPVCQTGKQNSSVFLKKYRLSTAHRGQRLKKINSKKQTTWWMGSYLPLYKLLVLECPGCVWGCFPQVVGQRPRLLPLLGPVSVGRTSWHPQVQSILERLAPLVGR